MKSQVKFFALLAAVAPCGLLVSSPASAQALSPTVEPGSVLRQLETQGIVEPRLAPDVVTLPEDQIGDTGGDTKKVFTLNQVVLDDSSVYSAEDIAALSADFIGQEVSFADLNTIVRRITVQYRQDGYIFSSAVLAPQKIKDGVVHVNVVEGRITEVEVVGDFKDDNDLIKKMAAKIEGAGPTNTAELERYLLLIDDLPGITARSVLEPADVQGGGKLTIIIEQKDYEGSIMVDNRGSRPLGRYRGEGTIAANSLFGIHDRTTVRGLITSQTDELRFLEVYHEEQVGTEGMRVTGRSAMTRTEPGGLIEDLNIEGESDLLELDVLYPWIRNRQYNVNWTAGFTYLNSKTDLDNVELSEDRLRYARVGTEIDFTDALAGVNLMDLELSRGLDIFAATEDGAGRSRTDGEHEFTRVTGTFTRLQGLGGKWSMLASASGQYAWDPLLSSEQFFLGGEAYGRAYDSGELSGDHGAAAVAELRYGGPTENNEYIDSYQFYGFYDIGRVWNRTKAVGENKTESLASVGLGSRFNLIHDISGYLEIDLPLTQSISSEGSDDDEEPRVFFSLRKRF